MRRLGEALSRSEARALELEATRAAAFERADSFRRQLETALDAGQPKEQAKEEEAEAALSAALSPPAAESERLELECRIHEMQALADIEIAEVKRISADEIAEARRLQQASAEELSAAQREAAESLADARRIAAEEMAEAIAATAQLQRASAEEIAEIKRISADQIAEIKRISADEIASTEERAVELAEVGSPPRGVRRRARRSPGNLPTPLPVGTPRPHCCECRCSHSLLARVRYAAPACALRRRPTGPSPTRRCS